MNIPLVNLKPVLEATAPEWQANLNRMFERMHFILGDHVASFEREFAAAMDARFAAGVGSGTAAIELCLREAHITSPHLEVITSPLTAPFTGLAILAAGATPRFADIDPDTLLLDADAVEDRANKRTAALLPVHLYGQPCKLPRFAALSKALGAVLVQDACQAHGAHYKGWPLTRYSNYVAFSFYPTKNLGCVGDGGAVVTNKRSVADRIKLLRDGGRSRRTEHVSLLPSINSRLDEIQACFLSAFLPNLAEWNARRARIAAVYDDALADCQAVGRVKRYPGSVHHLYVIRAHRRDRLREHLRKLGIGTGIHYPRPLHLHPAFLDYGSSRGDLPHAEKACREILSLPIWPHLPESDVLYICEHIRAFYR